MKKALIHAIILWVAVATIFLWVSNDKLTYFSLQLSAILLIILIIAHKIVKPVTFHLVESTISTMAILLVVEATGGINSPLFFLNYFLLFELSLLLEPVIPLLLAGSFMFFYFFTYTGNVTAFRWIELLAFPFMTPLAFYFGKIYRKEENQKRELKNLNKKIVHLEEELVEQEINK